MLMQTINYVPQILTLTGLAPSRSILRTLISSRMAFTSCWGRTRRIKSLNANILPDAKSLNYEYDLIYTIELKNMRKPSIYRLSVFFGGNESGGQPKLCAQSSNFRTSSSAFILHNKMTKIKFKIYLILYNKIFNKRKFCSTMFYVLLCTIECENRLLLFESEKWQFMLILSLNHSNPQHTFSSWTMEIEWVKNWNE